MKNKPFKRQLRPRKTTEPGHPPERKKGVSPPRKSRPRQTTEPGFARNQVELASQLGVDRKTVQRWRRIDGNPGVRSNGLWDVAAWREWVLEHGLKADETATQTDLKAQQIALQNEKLAFQIAVLKQKYVPAAKVEEWVGDMISQAKKVLLTGPTTLAPRVIGETVIEAEKILKEWLHDALDKLHREPLGKAA